MSRFGAIVRCRRPFVTVHFDASHDTEDAATAVDLRWRGISDQLAAHNADEGTLLALDEAVRRRRPGHGKVGRYLVGAEDSVLLDQYLPNPPSQPTIDVGPVPNLQPLLPLDALTVPHVVAVIDQAGADLYGFGLHLNQASRTVPGHTQPVHKVRAAGFAHYAIQHRVKETVKDDLATVATETARQAAELGAEVLVLAGEVQARTAVRGLLPQHARDITVELPGGSRSDGNDPEALEESVRDALRHAAADRAQAATARFGDERHGDGRSAMGLAQVAAAFRTAAVDTLFLGADPMPDREIWVGASPEQIALDPQDVGVTPQDTDRRTTAAAAVLAACAATGASAFRLPANEHGRDDILESDGVAALLRYPATVATAQRPT